MEKVEGPSGEHNFGRLEADVTAKHEEWLRVLSEKARIGMPEQIRRAINLYAYCLNEYALGAEICAETEEGDKPIPFSYTPELEEGEEVEEAHLSQTITAEVVQALKLFGVSEEGDDTHVLDGIIDYYVDIRIRKLAGQNIVIKKPDGEKIPLLMM